MSAYYNEHDPYAAQWLRNLIAAGHIAPGDVDERSIVDVRAGDIRGYSQCHFFAGIGGWSVALRLAGWDDERPVWSGSCPCQPFSAAGTGKAGDDERHLWPAWASLICECRPRTVFGEQVEAAIGWGWLDLVFTDLEAEGYACGAAILPAASVGAPHIRNRLWFVADAERDGQHEQRGTTGSAVFAGRPGHGEQSANGSATRGVADASNGGREPLAGIGGVPPPQVRNHALSEPCPDGDARAVADAVRPRWAEGRAGAGDGSTAGGGIAGGLADADELSAEYQVGNAGRAGSHERQGAGGRSVPRAVADAERDGRRADQPQRQAQGREADGRAGFWSDAEWLPCSDGKARPVKSSTQRMADGLPRSPSRLRPEHIAALEKEILDGRDEADARKAMHDLWCALWPEAVWGSAGRSLGLHEAGFLLAFMRQLAEQGWPLAQCLSSAGSEATQARLRGLQHNLPTSCSSCGRGLDEQRSGQCADPLHDLSSLLARHAQAAWGEAYGTHARACHPLAHGIARRPSKLRAYGNAIVPQVAAEFVQAFLEAAP